MAGYMLLSFLAGISVAIIATISVLHVLNRFKLIRNIQRDVDVDKRLQDCEHSINAIAIKLSQVSTESPSIPTHKDRELLDAGYDSIGRDA